MKIAVLGASGLVGATFVEHLLAQGEYDVRPIIHSSGNAWRLARWGMDLTSVDVLSPDSVRQALAGVTHVVNCTAGTTDVLVKGLKNILASCHACRIQRLVHLSSVLVYGERPAPESQLRGVRHSTERANSVLGSTSAYDFRTSMESYRDWYGEMYGHSGPFWDLYRQLG
jgi:nucleoside-diphosphate-sugar epimerase